MKRSISPRYASRTALRLTSMATVAVSGAAIAGCDVSQTTIYPLNGAKQAYVAGCKAQVAKQPGLSAGLRNALEVNCAHPNPTGVSKAIEQQGCQHNVATPGLSATLKSQLASSCVPGNNPAPVRNVAERACWQIVKNTVPPALQQRALATCPKP